MPPAYLTTPRTGIRYADTGNLIDNFAAIQAALASDAENKLLNYKSGLASAMGAAGTERLYRQTDTGQYWLDTGTVLVPLTDQYVLAASNATAKLGQVVVASPGVTVTLPAALAHQHVRVVAGATVTGASPVTVTFAGSHIFLPGSASAVGSFLLGTPLAAVELIADASGNWVMVSGQQDTGWLALTLATGVIQESGAFVPAARLRGDTVLLRGALQNTTAGSIAANGTWATVPAALRPPGKVFVTYPIALASTTPGPAYQGVMTTAGIVQVNAVVANGDVLGLDGVNYQIV